MQAVILAGGLGTRISEESHLKPKPMIEIGGKPILWHIMKIYNHYGISEFIICCGYKGYIIKEYFANYFLHMSDVTFDMQANEMQVHRKKAENWKVTLVDTGDATLTGGRLKRVAEYLHPDEPFCFTYGDGLADIDIEKQIEFHNKHGKFATMTAVVPPGRYGAVEICDDAIVRFSEKPSGQGGLINGGFFVLSPTVIDFIRDDTSSWEGETLLKLVQMGQLMSFEHDGFWQAMDTLREKNILQELWDSGEAPWKLWD